MKRLLAALLAAALLLGLTACGGITGGAEPTATPVPTAEPTPEPTATPAPVNDPLTGAQGDYANKRPVAVTLRTGDGVTPYWGVAGADVLIEAVTEGYTAGMTAVFSNVDEVTKAGPVGPARDTALQLTLPLNAVPVHINKNVYASNLLNVLAYQDLDGYHIGKTAFAFDTERNAAGYREENCWYTTADLIRAGLDAYGASAEGANTPLFRFGERTAPAAQNGTDLQITFSALDTEQLLYSADTGLYLKYNADGSPLTDADNGEQAAFTNVFVLYASSGIKDDGYTRQYDMSGGTGIYLTGGGWETIHWTKGDAAAPLYLTDATGEPLTVSPGKSFIAVWGGYYGQALRLLGADGAEQVLPERPALLESGVSDEAAAAAEAEYEHYLATTVAAEELVQLQTDLETWTAKLAECQAAAAAAPGDEAAQASLVEAQAIVDQLTAKITERQALIDAAAAETPAE